MHIQQLYLSIKRTSVILGAALLTNACSQIQSTNQAKDIQHNLQSNTQSNAKSKDLISNLASTNNSSHSKANLSLIQQGNQLTLKNNGDSFLSSPAAGLWSIAQNSSGLADLNWQTAKIKQIEQNGRWTIYSGQLAMQDGLWKLRDACTPELDRIKCIRRFEWHGDSTLNNVVLSIRWQINQTQSQVFQPGLMYYGNPAAKSNDLHRTAHMAAKTGEFTQFEEHRFAMPFTSLEWQQNNQYKGAALHTLPSPLQGANRQDLWWSLGAIHQPKNTELRLLSGPIGYNETPDVAKLFQQKSFPYKNATLTVKPHTIIEKTYYLEAYPVEQKGSGFRQSLSTSIDIFKPFYTEDMPSYQSIIEDKLGFTEKRFMTDGNYAGFNMFDPAFRKRIVMGWAGQSDAPGYFLLHFGHKLNRPDLINQAQSSLDFLTQSPFVKNKGFAVRYDALTNKWSHYDAVSQGQALFMFAKAIEYGRTLKQANTKKWADFFKRNATFHANRILAESWHPVSTNEGFLVAPLVAGYQLFNDPIYKKAALKAANHYAARHLTMEEPYWGGTLDARGEDKEGAWAGFQAFMAAYDLTQDKKYLAWAEHAADVMLSYTLVWDIPFLGSRLADHNFKTRGWTFVSPQNQHLDVYGVLTTPWLYRLGELTNNETYKRIAKTMYLSCGQMIDPYGSQGEQFQQTNFVQDKETLDRAGNAFDIAQFRGGYSENWTVLWITAHFLTAAAIFDELGVTNLDK